MASSLKPGKLYYTIGEVSRIANLPSSVLRYWETEFAGLKPPRNRSGKRLYRQKDIERILHVKKLLYEDRFTIEGARKALKQDAGTRSASSINETADNQSFSATEIQQELKEILDILKS